MRFSYSIGGYQMAYTIGVGTFGRVKLATHEGTGEKVAIKIINRARMQALEMGEKTVREISILQRISQHPNLIKLYELIDTPTDLFVVMEYVSGGELFDYIVQRSRLTEVEARHLFHQIMSGTEYLQTHMIAHRDLKPENLLLTSNHQIKIADFGLSNVMKDGEYLKTSCGSPNYAAPEVVAGCAYAGPEVDVWSCGVILYALLCGALPFDDESVPALFKKIRHGAFSLPGHISEPARQLIVRILSVDPLSRLTIREIFRDPWMRQAPAVVYQPVSRSFVDHAVLHRCQQLGYKLDVAKIVNYQSHRPLTPYINKALVAYFLLIDRNRRRAISDQGSRGTAGGSPTSASRDGNASRDGCASSPAQSSRSGRSEIESEGNSGAGSSESPHLPELSFDRKLRNSNLASVVFQQDVNAYGFLNYNAKYGIVKSSQPLFAPPTKPRLQAGLQTTLDPANVMECLYKALVDMDYDWQLLNSCRLLAKPVAYTSRENPDSEASTDSQSQSQSQSQSSSHSHELAAKTNPDSNMATSDQENESSNDPKIPLQPVPPIILCFNLFRLSGGKFVLHVQIFDGPIVIGLREALRALVLVYDQLSRALHLGPSRRRSRLLIHPSKSQNR